MARKRWIVPWKDSRVKPVFYHCISRVVDRNQVFGPEEKEKFRTFMRMQENFTGCRVVAYCLMSNHLHLLVEVPPMPEGGLTDHGLLERLRAIYPEAQVAQVAEELLEARRKISDGLANESLGMAIHARFSYRMHDLSEFMKTLMQRFTKWFNRTHQRTGNLWEDAFKSVIVEDGIAAKTLAAYIDLNPVRAGVVKDPADYRWSSYGEAIGGGPKGNGQKARAGLVRALRAHQDKALNSEPGISSGREEIAGQWQVVAREYRTILLAGASEKLEQHVGRGGGTETRRTRKGMTSEEVRQAQTHAGERFGGLPFGKMLGCRIRYFTDGAVIGSRGFVNDAFAGARERFGPKRRDGARKLRGTAAPAAGHLWSLRDLKKDVC